MNFILPEHTRLAASRVVACLLALILLLLTHSSAANVFGGPPRPDKAFKAEVVGTQIIDGQRTLVVRWKIIDGVYMYEDKFAIRADTAAVKFGEMRFPEGTTEDDPLFGEVTTHWDEVDIVIPYTLSQDTTMRVEFDGQGCHKKLGICYSPVTRTLSVDLPASTLNEGAVGDAPSSNVAPRGLLTSLGLAFLAGLALSLTPCVLPMVPILAGIVLGGSGGNTTHSFSRRLMLGIIFVLGTMVTYAATGAFAGLTGTQLQAWVQSLWTTIALIGLLVIMAIAMFGGLQIAMPAKLQSALQGLGQRKGGSIGVFLLGMTSALMVGACVTPILIGVIGGIVASGNALYGALTMAMLALGMGVPLLIVCVGVSHWLPKRGAWMNIVSHILGWGLLVVAAWLAMQLLPISPLWPLAALGGAILLYCVVVLRQSTPGWALGGAIFGSVMATIYAIGALQGGVQPIRPIALTSAEQNSHSAYQAPRVDTLAQLEAITAQGKPVIVDFWADWCTDCIRFERTTLADARVIEALQSGKIQFVQVDVSDPDSTQAQIQKKLGVYGPPAIAELRGTQEPKITYGYLDADAFLELLAL